MGFALHGKNTVALDELKARAFHAIKQHDGCEEVCDITICEIQDDSAPCNWRIGAVCVGSGRASEATRAAMYVEKNLQNEFYLLAAL
ncbi:MAG TPA: hypothetical protein VGF82_06125 [Terracidiphilus sp.]